MSLPHISSIFGIIANHIVRPGIVSVVGPASVNEGSAATINVTTSEIEDGTVLNWSISNAGDFSVSSGTVTINSNSGSFTVTPTADVTTEGAEVFAVTVSGTLAGYSISLTSSDITINDTSRTPTITNVSGPADVNEGSSASISVSTADIPNGTVLNWAVNNGTTTNADFSAVSGTVTINSNAGSFNIGTVADATTEGSETFTVTVSGTVSGVGVTGTSGTITINDTSLTPSIDSVTEPTSINEGSSGTITVFTTGIPDGTSLSWTIETPTSGTAAVSGDFSAASGTVTINSGTGSFTVSPIVDNLTEGEEKFRVSISGTVNSQSVYIITDDIIVNDTSTFGGTVDTVTGAPSPVNEGNDVTFTVSTSGFTNGTVLNWEALPVTNATNADFSPDSGTVTINSNSGTFVVTADEDYTTEGAQQFRTRVYGTVSGESFSIYSNTIDINDTSLTPGIAIVSGPGSVNEGLSATITVYTENIPDGTSLNWSVNHGTTAAGDFSSTSGTVTINSDSGSFSVATVADATTEGSETFTVTVSGTVLGTAVSGTTGTITINDTSTTPPTYAVTAPASINEGASGTMSVSTTNVSNGTTLYWTVTPSGDFGTSSGSFTINSNAGSFTVTPTADAVTEGAETGTIQIRTGSTSGTIVATDTFTINDTSTTPPTYAVTAPASINEGASGTMSVSTTNVANGTTLYWTVLPSGDFGTSSGSFSISSNAGSFTVTPSADATTEGAETGTIQIRTGSTSGTIVATDTFTINDTSLTPAMSSVTGPSSVNEGAAATISVSTANVPNGTTLNWTVNHGTSVAGDFSSTSGTVTINSNSGSFTVTPTADGTTEGAETFTVTVSGTVSGTAISGTTGTITINDTSTTPPTYSVTAPASINEGSAGTMSVSTTNVGNGTTLYWSVEPAGDFGTSSGSFTINSNAGSFSVTPTADATTEGAETGTIRIRTGSTSGTIVASDTFTINDTSLTPAMSSVTGPSSVNEGASATINVSTANVPNGTTLNWTVNNGTTQNADFSSTSGTVTINSNSGSFTVGAVADSTTEGAQTFTVTVSGTVLGTAISGTTGNITINDTSTTPPTYSVTAPASINEGSAGTMSVSTTNVGNGTTLYWTVTPSGDFGTSSGSFTINSNAGSFTVTPTADATTEGAETGTIQIRTGSTSGTIVASDTFTINDTSLTPAMSSVTGPSSVNEGASATINVSTANVPNGTTLNWAVNNVTTQNADFSSTSGTVTINSNSGSFTVGAVADSTTEGAQTFTVTVSGTVLGTSISGTTGSITINDTSQTPVPTYSVTAPASINEGSAGTMNVSTTNVANGTTLYWSVEPAGDFGTSSGSFSISSNAGSFTVTPTADATTEGAETGTIRIRTGSTSGTIVASDTFTINDTSQTPAPTYSVTAPASINEGSAGTMNVSTTNVANGTTLYWTVTPSGDFGTSSGSFSISSNAGSFTVTPTADSTTEGAETGTIQIRTGSISGTIVATDTFTINDTSTAPPVTAPSGFFSVNSSGNGAYAKIRLTVSNDGDWYVDDISTGSGSSNFSNGSQGTWLNSGSASDYDIKIDFQDGTSPDNVWLNLGTNRVWEIQMEEDSLADEGSLSIRNASTLTVLATSTITLEAEHFP